MTIKRNPAYEEADFELGLKDAKGEFLPDKYPRRFNTLPDDATWADPKQFIIWMLQNEIPPYIEDKEP